MMAREDNSQKQVACKIVNFVRKRPPGVLSRNMLIKEVKILMKLNHVRTLLSLACKTF